MKIDTKEQVIEYINSLKGYQGYVQFSNRAIDKDRDIFIDKEPKVQNEDGFIYEANFANDKNSINIKQINNEWLVATVDISRVLDSDIKTFVSDIENFNYKIKMAQIWQEESDKFCEGLKINNLKSVVFAGFEQ